MQLLVPWEEASLPLLISVVRSRLRQASWRHLNARGLTHQQFQALRTLASHPGLSHCELAGALGLDRPTATRLIQALVRKGWVASTPHPEHGRKLVLALTGEGWALEESLAGFRRTVRETLELGFDEAELRTLRELLRRLKDNLDYLERQGGGVGLRGGPGETQIEVDRRMTRLRISQLKKELQHLEKVRETQRQGRAPGIPRVSLVGYTNAGKTSILKALTGEGEPQDMLFATLDTTTRKAWLGHDPETHEPRHVLLSDTVGFIRKLPHQLVAAFRSTLGEVRTADALLVVADAASPELEDHLKVVGATLREIGCEDQPRLLVLNQVDRLPRPRRLDLKRQHPGAAMTCALTRDGLDDVRSWLMDLIPGAPAPRELEAWELPEAPAAEEAP